ncbi:MAG: hypothetical protein Kow0058_08030 [Roseovarius sp.]
MTIPAGAIPPFTAPARLARGRRRAAALALLLLLVALVAGCGAGASRTIGKSLQLTGQVGGVPPELIGPQRLAVTLTARGVQAVLGPVTRADGTVVWQTLDGVSLSFRDGILIASRGLGYDLMSADVSGTRAMLAGTMGTQYYPVHRSYLDGEDRTVFRSFQCRRAGGGPEGALRRVDELCVGTDRRFTNSYWLDPAGTVIRSRQWVGPVTEFMETQLIVR